MGNKDLYIIYPNAKININLYIGGKKKTWWGKYYHNISSLVVPINIFDRMVIKPGKFSVTYKKQDILNNEKPELIQVENCIIKRVLEKFEIRERDLNFQITIEKNIPIASGLGGPSSDAAFFIKFLIEQKLIKHFNKREIYKKSCEIGSDIPFFLYNKPAVIYDFGEKIKAVKFFPKLYFVIIQPFKKISTEIMYNELDRFREEKYNKKLINEKIKKNFKKNNKKYLQNSKNNVSFLSEIADNDFELIVAENYPDFLDWKLLFEKSLFASMSGAGSSIFGVYGNYKDAKDCFNNLLNIHGRVYICSCKT